MPAVGQPRLLETNKEARDHRRRRGEEVVRQNEPHPWGEGRKPDHHFMLRSAQRLTPLNYRPLGARATSRRCRLGALTNQSPYSGTIWLISARGPAYRKIDGFFTRFW